MEPKNLMTGNYPDALGYLIKANELTPNVPKIKNNLAMAYFFQNRPNTAIKILEGEILKDPKNSDARNNLASIYFRKKMHKQALFQYEQILSDLVYGHQYRTHHAIGLIREEFNQTKSASEHYKKP